MATVKRKSSNTCPQCKSQIERFIINTDCEISMCGSLNCSYPFNEQSAEGLNIETPNTSFKRYSKNNSKASSLSNTVAMPTPDDNNNAKSAKKARTGSYKPDSSSSSVKKQKDQSHLTNSSDSDVVKPTEHTTAPQLPPPSSEHGLHVNTLPQQNTSHISQNQPTVNTAANASESPAFTPPPEADYQKPKLSLSSTASSIATPPPSTSTSASSSSASVSTSPSSSPTSPLTSAATTTTAAAALDFALLSSTGSVFNEAFSGQLNDNNITQKAPPSPPSKPAPSPVSGLCLPPMAAATIAKVPTKKTSAIENYTLGDIETLLTIDNVNPSSSSSPMEELSWMEDYDDLFL